MLTRLSAACALVCALLVGGGRAGEQSSAAVEKARLAAELLIGRVEKKLGNMDVTKETLLGAIEGDKKAHQDLRASRVKCEAVARRALHDWYEAEVASAVKRAGATPGGELMLYDEAELKKLCTPAENVVQTNLSDVFPATFEKARREAVDRQWQRFTAEYYPTESDFESLNRGELRQQLVERHNKGIQEPVFSENSGRVGMEKVDEVLAQAEAQRDRQRRLLAGTSGGSAKIPEAIEKVIAGELADQRKEAQTREKHVYGIFPSVAKEVPVRSRVLAGEKLAAAIDEMFFKIKAESIIEYMRRNLKAHAQREASLMIARDGYAAVLPPLVLKNYLNGVEEAAIPGFQKFCEKELQGNARVSAALRTVVQRILDAPFAEARKVLAEEQFGMYYQPLQSEGWKVPESLLEKFSGKRVELYEPTNLPETRSGTPNDGEILEEVTELVKAGEAKLIQEGLAAMGRQLALVAGGAELLSAQVQAGNLAADKEELIKSLTAGVLQQWAKENLAKKYPELFSRTRKEIETQVAAMLARKTASMVLNSPYGGGQGSGSGGGEGDGDGPGGGGGLGKKPPQPDDEEEEDPDLFVDFVMDKQSDQVVISAIDVKTNKVAWVIQVSRGVCQKGEMVAKQLAQQRSWFVDWIAIMAAAKRDQSGDTDLCILGRVYTGEVPFGAIAGVRRCLVEALKNFGEQNTEAAQKLNLRWMDDEFDPTQQRWEGGKQVPRRVPKDFKRKNMPRLYTA